MSLIRWLPLCLLPATLSAQYASERATPFTIRIENVSTASTLHLSTGGTAPAPTAPGLWTLTDKGNPSFTPGTVDRGWGLESLAEDGNPGQLADYIAQHIKAVSQSGIFNKPVGDAAPGPITPGKAYEFEIAAEPGQVLTLAFMFGQSNDLFYAPGAAGIALFDKQGHPLTRDVTGDLSLWDAGTEVNEEPGVGPNQAPRQPAPHTGKHEREPIVRVAATHDGFTYPQITEVVRVTVTPTPKKTALRTGS
jgi:hypothetical protein